jgi:hypothetical protein
MIEQLPAWIRLADSLAKSLGSGESQPEFLPPNALLLFQRFRDAYEAMDAAKVGEQLSAEYCGTLNGSSDRRQLVEVLEQTFRRIPWGMYPKLTVTMYQVIERDEPGVFEAVLEFHSRFAVLEQAIDSGRVHCEASGLPVLLLLNGKSIDSGRVHCEARAEKPSGIWRIVRIDSIR